MLRGCITALATPFKNGLVDYDSFRKLLDFQLEQGVKGFIVNGTTAEAPTLSLEEKRDIVKFVVDYVPRDVVIGVGASSNDTNKMIKEIQNVEDLGFDYLLISTPYYNKTTQRGLIAHIEKALEVTRKKIILYNIPSRAGMNFGLDTLEVLAKHDQIVAIKEASGDFGYAQQLFSRLGDKLDVLCGNDDLTYLYATLGATGVISAVGNIYGHKYNEMYELIAKGDYKGANKINLDTLELSNLLFTEVNPILIKALLSKLGIIENELRLPLIHCEGELVERIYAEYLKVVK